MTTALYSEIQELVRRYLDNEISLRDFQVQFAAKSWDVEAHQDPAAEALVYEIELRLAEYTSGHRTEAELQELLWPIIVVRVYPGSPEPEPMRTGSSTDFITEEDGRPLVMALA